ncbi:unnamed protein product [Lupinus luteus]|uniref:Uncharacterized protein n=1 Tax=Lupinus luteus TaxID=3873 RepID=A0AAV1WF63_LUPLU
MMLKFFLIDVVTDLDPSWELYIITPGISGSSSIKDAWEDVDPDVLSYDEPLVLGEAVGTKSRGLSTVTIAILPSVNYNTVGDQHGSNDSYVQTLCAICRMDYEGGESLTVLTPTVRMTL